MVPGQGEGTPRVVRWTEAAPGEARGQAAHDAVLRLFHVPSRGGGVIVVAAQVQQSVHETPHHLGLAGGAEPPRLPPGIVERDDDIAAQSAWRTGRAGGTAVIERDDVGGTFVSQPTPVQAGHGLSVNQSHGQFVLRLR
jgi:hypothetical protein